MYTYICLYIFFKFRCHGIQIQNGQASCRQPHSRLTGKAENWNKSSQGLLSASEKLLPEKIKLFAISWEDFTRYSGPSVIFLFFWLDHLSSFLHFPAQQSVYN